MEMRDFAFGQRDNPYVDICHSLVKARDIFLIAGQSIHCLRQDQAEASAKGIFDQGLDTWPQKRCTGHGVVGVFFNDGPTLLLRMQSAHSELVCD